MLHLLRGEDLGTVSRALGVTAATLTAWRDAFLAASEASLATRGPRNHDGTIIADAVDTLWGTDLTATVTGEGQAAVFVAIDHSPNDARVAWKQQIFRSAA